MDNKSIFNELKEDFIQQLENTTIENYQQKKKILENLIKGLEVHAYYVSVFKENKNTEKKPNYVEEHGDNWWRGRLNRKLRGGTIGFFSVHIPEREIRNKQLNNGDWVQANKVESNRYSYTLLEKDPKENERKEAFFITVENQGEDFLYITLKDERLEVPMKIQLKESDVRRFSIKEGDIIDYAYFRRDLLDGLVVWKYDYGEKNQDKIIKKNPLPTVTEKKKSRGRKIQKSLERITVLMVGGDHKKLQKNNKEAVEFRGGNFLFLTGDETSTKINATVKKSDVVIVYTQSISHRGMYEVKQSCKEQDKKVSYTKNIGTTGFIQRCKSMIDK